MEFRLVSKILKSNWRGTDKKRDVWQYLHTHWFKFVGILLLLICKSIVVEKIRFGLSHHDKSINVADLWLPNFLRFQKIFKSSTGRHNWNYDNLLIIYES